MIRVLIWGISSVGRAPALQAGCQRFESAILHKRVGDTRAHISERKKNRKHNPCEREVGPLLVPPLLTSRGYSHSSVAQR